MRSSPSSQIVGYHMTMATTEDLHPFPTLPTRYGPNATSQRLNVIMRHDLARSVTSNGRRRSVGVVVVEEPAPQPPLSRAAVAADHA